MNVQAAQQKLEAFLPDTIRTAGLSLTWRFDRASPTMVTVVFDGPDTSILLVRNAELLLALEHLGTQILRLEPDQHELLSFDAGGFKAERVRILQQSAAVAIQRVRTTGRAFHFPPMTSRERRLLHLTLAPSGLSTESEGETPRRHLVLHPNR